MRIRCELIEPIAELKLELRHLVMGDVPGCELIKPLSELKRLTSQGIRESLAVGGALIEPISVLKLSTSPNVSDQSDYAGSL